MAGCDGECGDSGKNESRCAGHTVWEEFELHVSGLFRCDRERQFGLIGAMQWDRTLSTDLSLFLYGIRTLHSNRSR